MDGFAYNQSVELSATDQTVYQQDVVIHRTAGIPYEELVGGLYVLHFYVGDKCKADYGDVRFTDAAGNALAYYLWPDYDSSSARFTVRLTGATSAGELQVWYGNPSATTTSDGDATFDFYDDFSSGLSSDWIQRGTLTKQVVDGVLTVSGAGSSTGGTLYNNKNQYQNCILQTRAEIIIRTSGWYHSGIGLSDTTGASDAPSNHVMWGVRTTSGTLSAYNAPGGAITSPSIGPGFHDFSFVWGIDAIKFYCDKALKATHNPNNPSTPLYPSIWVQYSSGDIRCDWILVRAYSANPPSATAFSGERVIGGSKASTGVALGSANMMVI